MTGKQDKNPKDPKSNTPPKKAAEATQAGMDDFLKELKSLKGDKELVKTASNTMLFGKEKWTISWVTIVVVVIILGTIPVIIKIYFNLKKTAEQKIDNYSDLISEGKELLKVKKYDDAQESFKKAWGLAKTDLMKGDVEFLRGKTSALQIDDLPSPEAPDVTEKVLKLKREALDHFNDAQNNGYRSLELSVLMLKLLANKPHTNDATNLLDKNLLADPPFKEECSDPKKMTKEKFQTLYDLGKLCITIINTEPIQDPVIKKTHAQRAAGIAKTAFELILNAKVLEIPNLSKLEQTDLQELQNNSRNHLQRLQALENN